MQNELFMFFLIIASEMGLDNVTPFLHFYNIINTAKVQQIFAANRK
jgi:hypothetical protein